MNSLKDFTYLGIPINKLPLDLLEAFILDLLKDKRYKNSDGERALSNQLDELGARYERIVNKLFEHYQENGGKFITIDPEGNADILEFIANELKILDTFRDAIRCWLVEGSSNLDIDVTIQHILKCRTAEQFKTIADEIRG
jgi:hypothetical protein